MIDFRSCIYASAILLLAGCETVIIADTPCGRFAYRSTKDLSEPAARCVTSDGDTIEIGASASSGAVRALEAAIDRIPIPGALP